MSPARSLKALLALCVFSCALCRAPECFADSGGLRELYEAMKARYEGVLDYQCRMVEWSTEGGRYENRTMNFYFKKPRLIRMDILEGNRPFDSGSVAVYLGSGKVKGHRGGILKDIVLNVPRTSSLATTIRGVAIDESDMETVLKKIPYYLENGTISMTEGADAFEFVCVPFDASKNEGVSKDILRIDKKTLLVTYNERFIGDKSVQRVHWSQYIVNAGLPDELFDIHFDVGELSERGIPLIGQTAD